MASRSWSASGRRPARDRAAMTGRARPAGSFAVALARAREAWDGLTGGPGGVMIDYSLCDCGIAAAPVRSGPVDLPEHPQGCAGIVSTGRYSDQAAAAIIDAALRLWPDSAASMGEDPPED